MAILKVIINESERMCGVLLGWCVLIHEWSES